MEQVLRSLWQAVDGESMSDLTHLIINHSHTWAETWRNKNRWNWSDEEAPLHLAASKGNIPMVKALLRAGFDINSHAYNYAGDDWACIHMATLQKDRAMISALLVLGADHQAMAATTQNGFGTALDIAKDVDRSGQLSAIFEDWCITQKRKDSVMNKHGEVAHHIVMYRKLLQNLQCKRRVSAAVLEIQQQLRAQQEENLSRENIVRLQMEKNRLIQQLIQCQNNIDSLDAVLQVCVKDTADSAAATDDQESCPICFNKPSKVFVCTFDTCEYWFCSSCCEKLDDCPQCRRPFTSFWPRRSRAIERLIETCSETVINKEEEVEHRMAMLHEYLQHLRRKTEIFTSVFEVEQKLKAYRLEPSWTRQGVLKLRWEKDQLVQSVIKCQKEINVLDEKLQGGLKDNTDSNAAEKERQECCPICYNKPSQVFVCTFDTCEYWICSSCLPRLNNCPQCRTSYQSSEPRRCRAIERLLG